MSIFWRRGDPLIWSSGLCLLVLLLMILGMLWLILSKGLIFFWPRSLVQVELADDRQIIGEIAGREEIPHLEQAQKQYRIQIKVGNRDVYGQDFRWIPETDIQTWASPSDLVCIERLEYGNMYGRLIQVRPPDSDAWIKAAPDRVQSIVRQAQDTAHQLEQLRQQIAKVRRPITELEKTIEEADLGLTTLAPDERALLSTELEEVRSQLAVSLGSLQTEQEQLNRELEAGRVKLILAGGAEHELAAQQIVRVIWANQIGVLGRLGIYLSRFWEFLSDDPREANMEGGIFPAIFGTVMMVMIMTLVVVPFGVLTAIYLHEYAKDGFVVQFVRIAMNNLAGVPSIVFGMFGLGFFIYFVGGGIDHIFFADRLPSPTFGTGGILWASLTLALLTLPVVVVSTEEALAAVPLANRQGALALAATKLQMLWHVVLPNALPGILTGMILAVSRGAGEVAPLMITGAVKLAPNLPLEMGWPFLHLERKFMHLGFHIYDVGFQSPNVEAAKPMVYTTALLLIGMVLALNIAAMLIRNRLRKRYRSSAI